MKAVIPAAGLGTRFLPYTRSQPKEMLPIVDKPAIQYVVEEAVTSGLRELLIVTGRGKRAIEDHFDRNVELERAVTDRTLLSQVESLDRILETVSIFYVRQKEHRGLGHAVLVSERYVGAETFSVLLGDDLTFDTVPCQESLIKIHQRTGGSVLAVQEVSKDVIGRYGMALVDEERDGVFRITKLIEKPKPHEASSNLATLGRYVLTPSIFRELRATACDVRGEIQLTDAIAALLGKEDVYAMLFRGRRYDVGDKVGWLRANIELAMLRPDMRDDVQALVRGLNE